MTDPLARARGYEDQPETPWKPSPGDVVGGTVVALDTRSTQFDPAVPVVTLETDDGERVAVWGFWTVLRTELAKLAPQVGDSIAVRRLSDAPGGGYRRFRVFSDRDEGSAFDWGSVETDAGDVQQREPLPDDDAPVSELYSRQALEGNDDLPF